MSGARVQGSLQQLEDKLGIPPGIVIRDEFHVVCQETAGLNGLHHSLLKRGWLHMAQIFDLNRADRGHHLQAGGGRLLQGVPGLVDAFRIQIDLDGNPALTNNGGNGFDQQAVHLLLANRRKFDEVHIQSVDELAQLDLFPKAQRKGPAVLFERVVADLDTFHV